MGILGDLLASAAVNPEVRKFAGRLMATAAHNCAAPNCTGKSLPGVACVVCAKAMCNTHATARLVAAPPQPLCPPCAMQLWNADADEARPPDPISNITKPRNGRKSRKRK